MSRLFALIIVLSMHVPLCAEPLKLLDSYPRFDQAPVSLKSVLGSKPVYLKFWATWCIDCRRELPSLQQSYEKHQQDIAMFAVNLNINESDKAIRKLQQESGLTMPIIMDQHGSIASNFRFVGTPFHVLIDTQGQVVYTTYRDDAKLAFKLEQLANRQMIEPGPQVNAKLSNTGKAIKLPNNGTRLLYFSATWCDAYMVDVEPNIAQNCLQANDTLQQLLTFNPQVTIEAFVTHLWTETKDLQAYKQRLKITYPVNIDDNNALFQHYQATGYPTVIVLKQGKEVARFSDFSQAQSVLEQLKVYF